MNQAEIEQISREIEGAFLGCRVGKVFPITKTSLAIALYPHNGAYLFIDFDSKIRETYLIRRRLKVLERTSIHASPFVIQLRKQLTGLELASIDLEAGQKILYFRLISADDATANRSMVIHLGGKIANIFIIDGSNLVLASARTVREPGQAVGEIYLAPPTKNLETELIRELNGRSLSDLLDDEGCKNNLDSRFATLASAARKKIASEIVKLRKLTNNLEGDLARHGNADKWKRLGDLILANISTLRRDGDTVFVKDYFDPDMAEITIAIDKSASPSEAAESYFKRYIKARNGAAAIRIRMDTTELQIGKLIKESARLEAAINAQDEQVVADFLPVRQPEPVKGRRKDKADDFKGARKFVSTDGFEILVGKKGIDNDYLTFRVAKSLDQWLHAADYPGSHVVIRNPNRKEIPVQTLIEAAQLAAFYSDAREKPKAAVNYTPKKFVKKPKRAAPGLVSLASFKTILVEPQVPSFLSQTDTK